MADVFAGIASLGGSEFAVRWFITLAHFLWQGAVVGALFLLGTGLLRHSSARARYALTSAALLALPVCVGVTFRVVQVPAGATSDHQLTRVDEDSATLAVSSGAVSASNVTPRSGEAAEDTLDITSVSSGLLLPEFDGEALAPSKLWFSTMLHAAPWITAAWAVGVACFLMRLCLGLWGGQRLRAATVPVADEDLLALIADQANRIGLKCVPLVAWCERVAVPTVVGVLRPVVLLPLPLMTGLKPEDVAVVVRHELAHVHRHDLWMNLIQRVIESLFFFHPVVWLISRRLSTEREICCDELVVSSGCEPLEYAGALVRTAELCRAFRQSGVVAVAATGNQPTELEQRIERLVQVDREPRLQLNRLGMTGLLLLLTMLFAAPAITHVWAGDASGAEESASATRSVPADDLTSDDGGIGPSARGGDADESIDEQASPTARRMTIRVVDTDGAPIKGAIVRKNHVYRLANEERSRIENHQDRTDADGKAVITLAGVSVDLRLWASSPGMSPMHAMWAPLLQSDGHLVPDSFTFRLHPGTTIGGTVLDETGEPIEGVNVNVMNATVSIFYEGTAQQPGVRPVPSLWLASGESVVTDALGHWELHNVPPDASLISEVKEPSSFFGQNEEEVRRSSQKLKLRFSHPEYLDDETWGQMQGQQNVTLELLRDQSAVIVMTRDVERGVAATSDRADEEKPAETRKRNRKSGMDYRTAEVQATEDVNGTWRIVRRTINGDDDKTFEHFDYYYWMFDASNRTMATRYRWDRDSRVTEGEADFSTRFIVNPATEPRQLTMYGRNVLLQCIYEQNGDELKVAYFGRAETVRPISFRAQDNKVSVGHLMVYYLERVDPEEVIERDQKAQSNPRDESLPEESPVFQGR